MRVLTHGYAAHSADTPLAPFAFDRRALRDDDVQIEILYSGVCHSDLHAVRNHWQGSVFPDGTLYPCVPGHEIVGRVEKLGAAVSGFAVGNLVGVGTMLDSCLRCEACAADMQCYCERGPTWTYNSPDRIDGENTRGGYADRIVVRERFVLHVRHRPEQLGGVAPLLCAGITMWSPLTRWDAGPGRRVGIIGIGGLGHMGLKLAHALGATVVALTTSPSKSEDALALGADEVVVTTDPHAMAVHAGGLDLIVDTVAVPHDLDPALALVRREGTLVLVGIPANRHPSPSVARLIGGRRSLAGSNVGGLKETQEMLDFCAERSIVAETELIPAHRINDAFERMLRNDVRYRFVIDAASFRPAA